MISATILGAQQKPDTVPTRMNTHHPRKTLNIDRHYSEIELCLPTLLSEARDLEYRWHDCLRAILDRRATNGISVAKSLCQMDDHEIHRSLISLGHLEEFLLYGYASARQVLRGIKRTAVFLKELLELGNLSDALPMYVIDRMVQWRGSLKHAYETYRHVMYCITTARRMVKEEWIEMSKMVSARPKTYRDAFGGR